MLWSAFQAAFLGVEDRGGESQAVAATLLGRYLVIRSLRCRPPDLAVVQQIGRPGGLLVLEDSTSVMAGSASIASKPTSVMGHTTGLALRGAHMRMTG